MLAIHFKFDKYRLSAFIRNRQGLPSRNDLLPARMLICSYGPSELYEILLLIAVKSSLTSQCTAFQTLNCSLEIRTPESDQPFPVQQSSPIYAEH